MKQIFNLIEFQYFQLNTTFQLNKFICFDKIFFISTHIYPKVQQTSG